MTHKLSHLVGDVWVEHSHAPKYEFQDASDGTNRLVSGAPAGDLTPFKELVLLLNPPYVLLYVLHTPRGEAQPGRYMSPSLSASEFTAFVTRFESFLGGDARFDIWARSLPDSATVVWDRHNQLFAYGPLEQFASRLRGLGFTHAPVAPLGAHQHFYRAEFDQVARDLLAALAWEYSPLRPEDEQ